MEKKKASMQQVMADIKPYIKKRFMGKSTVNWSDVPIISRILLSRYKNIMISQGLEGGIPCLKIQVKGLFSSSEQAFEVINDGRKTKKKKQKQQDLSWIDELEEIDAALDDGF